MVGWVRIGSVGGKTLIPELDSFEYTEPWQIDRAIILNLCTLEDDGKGNRNAVTRASEMLPPIEIKLYERWVYVRTADYQDYIERARSRCGYKDSVTFTITCNPETRQCVGTMFNPDALTTSRDWFTDILRKFIF